MTSKTTFLEGWFWFKFNVLGLVLDMVLKFYTSVAKRLKLKVRKFWWLIPAFVEIKGEKLVGGHFNPYPPFLNGINWIKQHPLRERKCKFKIDKITYSKHSVELCITLPKISLQCILIKRRDFNNLTECIVAEIIFNNKKCFFTCICMSPLFQNHDQLGSFSFDVRDSRPTCFVMFGDFNANSQNGFRETMSNSWSKNRYLNCRLQSAY